MLTKAQSLAADMVFMDLEDSVAPLAKEEARGNIIDALKNNDWGEKTVVVRINSIDTQWAADDLQTVVGSAGRYLDCIMIPKVQHAHEVMFVDHMLRMIETNTGLEERIGIEAQIETATGLKNVHDIAHASDRTETLIFGPADMSASLGLPTLTAGLPMPGYPGDHWHHVLSTILIADPGRVRQGRCGAGGVPACHRRRGRRRGDVRERDDRRGQPEDGRAAGRPGTGGRPGGSEDLGRVPSGVGGRVSVVELTDEQKAVVAAVRDLVEQEVYPIAEELEHRDEFPEKVVERMKEMGLFGLTVPDGFGGAGMDLMSYALVVSELSRGWISLSGVLNTHFMGVYLLTRHGTDEQKER